MESTRTKAEAMKPVLLKAGIPLALSVAGFIYAKTMVRRSSVPKELPLETQVNSLETDSHEEFRDEESLHSLESTSIEEDEEKMITNTQFMNSMESLDIRDKPNYEEEILGLISRVRDLQEREWELETRFLRYLDLKEKELVLLELRHMLSLEMTRIEFLGREISSMEAENQRLESLVVEYMKVLDQLEFLKMENGMLRRKVKKLSRKTKDQTRVIREHNLKIEEIEAREAEILSNCDELERKAHVIKDLEYEIEKLHAIMDQLQEEKSELLKKLELAEKSASSISKIEAEGITKEDYNKLSNELEQLQNDRAAEVKELIYLRWSNACLRHELMRIHDQQEQQNQEKQNHLELNIEGSRENNGDHGFDHELHGFVLEHGESCLGITNTSQASTKRRKLLQKFRRWVEGSERMNGKLDEQEKHEAKCLRRHSVPNDLHERKSCSSA